MKNKLKIVRDDTPSDEQIAWENVQRYYVQLKTLDEINPKMLNRAGKQMREVIFSLLHAIDVYDKTRSE